MKISRVAFAIGATLTLSACDNDQLAGDATLAITPDERSFDIVERQDADGRCFADASRFVDLPVLLILRDGRGQPLGDVEVSVYVGFADNTFGPRAPVALYEDRNDNGVVDADSELASGEDDDIARVRLDDESGARAMLLRVNLSCSYRTELFAFVDGASASASIEVVAREVIGPDGTVMTPDGEST